MTEPMDTLDYVRVEEFGCVRDATLTLGRLHALIGPNDSGKSTLLAAVHLALSVIHGDLSGVPQRPLPKAITLGTNGLRCRLDFREDRTLTIQVTDGEFEIHNLGLRGTPVGAKLHMIHRMRSMSVVRANVTSGDVVAGQLYAFDEEQLAQRSTVTRPEHAITERLRSFGASLARVPRLLRLDPDALRAPTHLLREGEAVFFKTERGLGLSAVLDAIRDRGDQAYAELTGRLCQRFPNAQTVQLDRGSDPGIKSISVRLRDGTVVPAALMSEGMLYFLAFLLLEEVEPAFFLVEEPENGLHPVRIGDVMTVLRSVSERSQVVVATHSPLVVNELEAKEVSVVRRPIDGAPASPGLQGPGTVVTLLSDTPGYTRRSQVYANGELWLNYANGTDEAPLVEGGERP